MIYLMILAITWRYEKSTQSSENDINFEDMRKKLEWSECFILEDNHPWNGLRVRKRVHPFVYNNESRKLLKEREYQLNLCDCYQLINHLIDSKEDEEENIINYEFKHIMSVDKIEIRLNNCSLLNISSIRLNLEIDFGHRKFIIPQDEKKIRKDNDVIRYRFNP
ncbi:hypothetical protein MXB_475, partial [Myxobolus squamalis]